MARKYQKKSAYWDVKRQAARGASSAPVAPIAPAHAEPMLASFDDEPHYSAVAACGGGPTTNSYRDQTAPAISNSWVNQYPNIKSGILPFSMVNGGYYGVSEAIGLAYQAYFSYAVLRNAINLLCDFSVGKIHVKSSNARVKKFIEQWFEIISINQFQAQFFLEYYRSGNVFPYKFSGKVNEESLRMLKESYAKVGEQITAARGVKLPIKYIILNPMQVYLQNGPLAGQPSDMPYGWVRMLSTYEITRLRNPQTPQDVQELQSFPPQVQALIKNGGTYQYLFVPLDPNRLYYVFYRKQDYEPLAVPMCFGVLNDIEYKLGLRKMDMALAATIERVILLVTTGRPADMHNPASSAENLISLQNMFRSQTIGRVLIADHTTKAQWVIPDFKELLGPDKYQQVDRDIKEGLQYMFFGDEKFANASIKIKIFIESLKEGRRAFMENFLVPEVRKVCQAMGFRNIPELEFEDIRIQDEALMARLYVQMGQLGLLTDAEVNTAISTGMLPNKEESLKNQAAYIEERAKGFYSPLAAAKGGPSDGGGGRPMGSGGSPAPRQVASPLGETKASDDPIRESGYRFGMIKMADNLTKMNELKAKVEQALIKKWKIKEDLSPEQKAVAATMTQSIVFNEPEGKWSKSIPAYLKSPKDLPEDISAKILDIRSTFHTTESPVDSWVASVLLRSQAEVS